MPFIQKSFPSTGGADLGQRILVERSAATELAFIDSDWGCHGSETIVLNTGLAENQERDVSAVIPGGTAYPVAIEVTSDHQGELSIYDGTAWHGPYQVTAGSLHGMLVRLPTETLRVKFKALQASSRVFIQSRTVPSVRAMAAI